MTVADLLTAALQELNIFDASTAIGGDDQAFALARFNDCIDAWQTEGLTVHQVTRVTWPFTGAASYTIGIGATINVPRPVSPQAIEAIGYVDAANPMYETLVTLLGVSEYATWANKSQTSDRPSAFYYNPSFGSTGYGTIVPLPITNTTASVLGVIYVPTPVAEFAAATATLSVPPGYRRFFRLNLAVELAGAYQIPMPPGLEERANQAKANIKRANIRIEEMSLDGAFNSGYGAGGSVDMGGWTWTGDSWIQL